MFEGVSQNSTGAMDITLGDAGGLESAGYDSTSMNIKSDVDIATLESTAEFIVNTATAAYAVSGTMALSLKDSANFTWVATHNVFNGNDLILGSGVKSLSAELTQVSVSGGTFDAGSINVMYQ